MPSLCMHFWAKGSKQSNWLEYIATSSVLNFLYGIFVFFTDYGDFGNIIGAAISTLVGLYILAQIRNLYKQSYC